MTAGRAIPLVARGGRRAAVCAMRCCARSLPHSPSTFRRSPAASSIRPTSFRPTRAVRSSRSWSRSRSQVRYPACRRHRHLARRPGDRALRQRTVPHLEARREGQEQRRAAAGRAERAPGAHRGRLRARRHADRCAVQGHHRQCHYAALQGRRFRRRHCARRRRHHHGAHHRRLRMAAAPGAAARQRTDQRPVQLALHRAGDRIRHDVHRLARVPLVCAERGAEHSAHSGGSSSSGGSSGGGGFSGGGGSSGGGGASGSW